MPMGETVSALDEYAELVNYKNDLFILELGCGGGSGLYAIAKSLRKSNKIICVDKRWDCIKIADAIADTMSLSEHMCGFVAYFDSLPFSDETFDVVCMHFSLDSSLAINKTIQEVSRVLKKDGLFVNLSNAESYARDKRIFELFDIPKFEWRNVYKKVKLYSGFDDLIDLSKENNLYLSQHKSINANGQQIILAVFKKDN